MKIAILHEMLVKLGGAEKVVEKMMAIFSDADLYTLIYDEEKVGKVFGKDKVKVSMLTQRIYKIIKNQRFCLPFMSRAVESLDFSNYDVLLCSSSGFAHGAITKPETKFIVYYHSPSRYLWDWTNEYKRDIGFDKGIKGYILSKLFLKLRIWDYIASNRVDVNLANSKNSALRVKKYYRKDCEILYPPIEISRFSKSIEKSGVLDEILKKEKLFNDPEKISGSSPNTKGSPGGQSAEFLGNLKGQSVNKENSIKDSETISGLSTRTKDSPEGQSKKIKYYIIISTLTEFKKIDVAIEGFNRMQDKTLVIIGGGNYKDTLLSKVTGNNIIFTGPRYGDELVELVQGSLGLVFPGEEDFGIVPIEAMAAGKPIFAYAGGGLLETVLEDKTGSFFQDKEGYDFVSKFSEFDSKVQSGFFKKDFVIDHAKKFDEINFENRLKEIVFGKK
ncbi:MAG: glycosyltransferase [Candidatus Gracilibacteria bacterium]|nr:glycosyltransferase [Candidatus Gracilibacteria bacterium]